MHCSEPPSMQAVRQKDSMSAFLSLCSASWSTKELRKHQTESLSMQSCSFWLIVRSSSHPVWSQGDKKVFKYFGFTAKLGWPSKVGRIEGSKFWTLTVLLVKILLKKDMKGHEDAASVLKRVTRKEVMHFSSVRHILLWLRLLVQLILMTVPSCKIQWQWQLQSKSSNNWTLWCWH